MMTDDTEGLEILSIGSLYCGPCEKKYWSTTRGKDRYPYPVGYLACRVYSGTKYKMEIAESPTGPTFMISSAEGISCCGKTPDIAWSKFQKKTIHSKLWRGKNFSGGCDGPAIFGFKNPLVLRLLRELVTNVNGLLECNVPSPSGCNEVQEDGYMLKNPSSASQPYVLDNFPTKKISRKRSDQLHESNTGLCGAISKRNQGEGQKPSLVKLDSVEEPSMLDGCSDLSNSCPEPAPFNMALHENLLDNSQANPTDGLCQLSGDVDIARTSNESQVVSGLCAPDSCTCPEVDNLVRLESSILNDKACDEETISESHQDRGFTSYLGSKYCDMGSLEKDVTNSMMNLLLPQAIPLLEVPSRKRKLQADHLHKNHEESRKDAEDSCILKHEFGCQQPKIPGSILADSDVVKSAEHDSAADQASHLANESHALHSDGHELSFYEVESNVVRNVICHGEENVPGKPERSMLKNQAKEDPKYGCDNDMISKPCGNKDIGRTSIAIDAATASNSTKGCERVYRRKKSKGNSSASIYHKVPLSESIVHRNSSDNFLHHAAGNFVDSIHSLGSDFVDQSQDRNAVNLRFMVVTDCSHKNSKMDDNVKNENVHLNHERMMSQANIEDVKGETSASIGFPLVSDIERLVNDVDVTGDLESNKEKSNLLRKSLRIGDTVNGYYELFGCYHHPKKIKWLVMRINSSEITIFIFCDSLVKNLKTLFHYNVSLEKERTGVPTLLGHSPLFFSSPNTTIVEEKSFIDLSPDGNLLAVLCSIKFPYCREGNIDCVCQVCGSECCGSDSVKIVRVDCGYVTVVTNLRANFLLNCLLILEPNLLLVSGDGGTLHSWTMNSTWSSAIEEFSLKGKYDTCTCILQLKTIPTFPSLVVGRNGTGEFLLWDVSKRMLLSRFLTSNVSVIDFSPFCVFNWDVVGGFNRGTEEMVSRTLDATRACFQNMHRPSPTSPLEDPAIWLLLSTHCDGDTQPSNPRPQQRWRLGLLVKNTLLLGHVLDPRGAWGEALGGSGIIGREDGAVYSCDLLSGTKQASLYQCKDGNVPFVAADPSRSAAFAVADADRLLLYRRIPPFP